MNTKNVTSSNSSNILPPGSELAYLHWAYRLGEVEGRWGAGMGAVIVAVLAFQAVMVAGRVALG